MIENANDFTFLVGEKKGTVRSHQPHPNEGMFGAKRNDRVKKSAHGLDRHVHGGHVEHHEGTLRHAARTSAANMAVPSDTTK